MYVDNRGRQIVDKCYRGMDAYYTKNEKQKVDPVSQTSRAGTSTNAADQTKITGDDRILSFIGAIKEFVFAALYHIR